MQRPIISYDDIALPYESPPRAGPAAPSSSNANANASQSKKRKWSNQNHNYNQKSGGKNNNNNARGNGGISIPAPAFPKEEEQEDNGEDEDPDSRFLTSEEIWDDSALIDAWNAATEEYEALNGPDKGWKSDPVHKSPLWYNVPPNKPPKKKLKTAAESGAQSGPGLEGDADSKPFDFATFVPTYDASLEVPEPVLGPGGDYNLGIGGTGVGAIPPPAASIATQDEAFSRALGAMYWGGYWTAVYHCHRSAAQQAEAGHGEEEEVEEEEEEEVQDELEEEKFVPSQR